ncbi:hypothetical protein BS47DRAFT_1374169 [Hydnum rufescens UP504]|uniref:Ribonuclease PIN domain-containing protein n=1 Tax=Hydnum rufescens UP504 TaxID=1448309 RepID=A0A9P6AIE2_9AGAM|nr:hypothetical protein BS47DRAFT_1374169 [Hydnum rufescens UP504]
MTPMIDTLRDGQNFVTTPGVIAELKDQRAREYFEQLGLTQGVHVQVRNPDATAIAAVSVAAKKSGDFSVLSRTDLLLLSLTYNLHMGPEDPASALGLPEDLSQGTETRDSYSDLSEDEDEDLNTPPEREPVFENPMAQKIPGESQTNDDLTSSEDVCLPDLSALTIVDLPESSSQPAPSEFPSSTPVFQDPSSEDDGEGEWITPDNVAIHQARERFSIPDASGRKAAKTIDEPLHVACMTADYAMQNVLLHMGLNIVGLHGKKITTVKSWVLRCHACSGGEAVVLVHLKKNFQYRNRGTVYSIPSPKPGNAKGSKNIILREDQIEFQRGLKNEEVRARKEGKRLTSALAAGNGAAGKSWVDPDWMPDMLLGQTSRRGSVLPEVGYGKRNPNAVRQKKK